MHCPFSFLYSLRLNMKSKWFPYIGLRRLWHMSTLQIWNCHKINYLSFSSRNPNFVPKLRFPSSNISSTILFNIFDIAPSPQQTWGDFNGLSPFFLPCPLGSGPFYLTPVSYDIGSGLILMTLWNECKKYRIIQKLTFYEVSWGSLWSPIFWGPLVLCLKMQTVRYTTGWRSYATPLICIHYTCALFG